MVSAMNLDKMASSDACRIWDVTDLSSFIANVFVGLCLARKKVGRCSKTGASVMCISIAVAVRRKFAAESELRFPIDSGVL